MIGRTISHYRILEKLGEGGMGVVYKAEDLKLKRAVALKFLSSRAVAGDEERVRFQREAQAAAALSHPNICTVHEIDEFEGQPFIAMECIDGRSLKQIVAGGPLKLETALATALQVAEGLQEAHKAGIVHRDIKPANVMVTREGRVKIMDFGLATSRAATRVTREGTTLGTVVYMSPEQARGELVDHRTDIWSFGAMLYEMVSGRAPFEGDSEQAVIYAIFNDEPPPLTGLRTGVPVELERIAGKCLAKDPGERYQTAADLLADLRRLQRVSASGTPAPRPVARGAASGRQAKRWIWAAILVVVVAVTLGLLRRHFMSPRELSVAERPMLVVLPFENLGAPEDEYFADGVTEEITSRLATLGQLGIISRTSAVTYKDTPKTIKQIGEELQVDYVLEGTVRWDRSGEGASRVRVTPQLIRVSDDTHLWSERYDRRLEDVFAIQSDVAEQVVAQLGITLLEPARRALQVRPTENLDAYQAYLRGLDYSKQVMYSEENWRRVIRMFERAVELDPTFAVAYAELSQAHSEMVNLGYDRTPERLELARAAVDEALKLQPDQPEAHLALGYYYYWGLQEYDKALAEFAVAAERLPSESDVIAATAWIKRRQGRWQESLDLALRAMALSPRDAGLAREVANNLYAMGRHAQAVEYYDHSIALAPNQQAAYVLKAMNYLSGWGDIARSRAVLEEMPGGDTPFSTFFWQYQEMVERNFQAALDRIESCPFEMYEGPNKLYPKGLLAGWLLERTGQPEAARRAYESALALLEKVVQDRPDDFRAHSALGVVYALLGRKEEAVKEGELGVELYPVSRDALHGPEQVEMLALIHMTVGDHASALKELALILSIPYMTKAHLLRIDPRWDPLRDDPGFQQLLEKHTN